VRRVTRRKLTPEEKVRIVLEGFRGEAVERKLVVEPGSRPAIPHLGCLFPSGPNRVTGV